VPSAIADALFSRTASPAPAPIQVGFAPDPMPPIFQL
jgi:hypothetical protein